MYHVFRQIRFVIWVYQCAIQTCQLPGQFFPSGSATKQCLNWLQCIAPCWISCKWIHSIASLNCWASFGQQNTYLFLRFISMSLLLLFRVLGELAWGAECFPSALVQCVHHGETLDSVSRHSSSHLNSLYLNSLYFHTLWISFINCCVTSVSQR